MRVAVIQGIWPHYRLPLSREMDQSGGIEYTFFSSNRSAFGIKHADTASILRFRTAPYYMIGRLLFQPTAIMLAFSRQYDAIVYLGDPHHVSTWIAAPIARLRGIKVLFWTHGWRRRDTRPLVSRTRNLFYRLADRLLIYAERGKQIGIASGYPASRMVVVYNSLDADSATDVVAKIESASPSIGDRPQALFLLPQLPLLICTARLTSLCRFDLLIEAAAKLARSGTSVNVLLVGDGPERDKLAVLAAQLNVDAHFFGACYDEAVLGKLLYYSDLTVSPGKVGLTALHSLMYGTPVITHDNLDQQMPEVELIEHGKTGALFRQGDPSDLACAIHKWLTSDRDRTEVRLLCRDAIKGKWEPRAQAKVIRDTLLMSRT